MILSFKNQGTQDIFDGINSRSARKLCPPDILGIALRKLDQLNSASDLSHLKTPPGNRLEELSGNRHGQHSVRINKQYRICFNWTEHGPQNVEIIDYH